MESNSANGNNEDTTLTMATIKSEVNESLNNTERESDDNDDENNVQVSDNDFDEGDEDEYYEQRDVFTIHKSDIENEYNKEFQLNEHVIDEEDEEVHTVSVILTIAAAFPSESARDSPAIPEEQYERGEMKRLIEGPKPQNYYKFEYQLMPDETETTITEVVTYKVAAKLFPDKQEPKVVKTWEVGNQIWVAWTHTHELKLTKKRLLKLFEHEFNLKIWDLKEFCSIRTKFDKPKAFKLPQTKPGEVADEFNDVKTMVLKQCSNYLNFIPKELHDNLDRQLPAERKQSEVVVENQTIEPGANVTNTVIAVSTKPVPNNKIGNKLTELAADNELLNSQKTRDRKGSTALKSPLRTDSVKSRRRSSTGERSKRESALDLEQIKKTGVCNMKLKMKVLFGGFKTVTIRLEQPIQTLEDCFVTFSLDGNLMSERQLESLNPIMVKIEKITDLPEKPISFTELKSKCEPVYCLYRFFNQHVYKTESKEHSKVIFYNDINVYLGGLFDPNELKEFLYGAPFEIEVHDRDRRPDKIPKTPCLFGNDTMDDHISSVNAIASKNTVYNPFEIRNKLWDPYGIVKLNLEDLLFGKRLIQFYLPISPCSAPESIGRSANISRAKLKSSTPLSLTSQTTINQMNQPLNTISRDNYQPIQAGNYLDCNSHLHVTVSIAKPLMSSEELSLQSRNTNLKTPATFSCAFGRIVCIFDYKKTKLISLIFQVVKNINASTLKLTEYPKNMQEAALSTYKLSAEQQTSKTLDIVTGFHFMDGKTHIMILEGLKDYGLKLVYESIPRRKHDGIKILYNSSMIFTNRLYASLDVDLLRIKLFEPLQDLVKKPLLYVRDMAPKPSVDALLRLNQLLSTDLLRDVARCDLFPTAEMIVSMSREFGAPLTNEDIEELKAFHSDRNDNTKTKSGYQPSTNSVVFIPHTSKVWTPIDNFNSDFVQIKLENTHKDYMKNNIEYVQIKSEENRSKKPVLQYAITEGPVFNYSCQTLNSAQITIDKIRESINKYKNKGYYTYNPDIFSRTFIPVDIENIKKEEEIHNKERWLSNRGWSFPGMKSALKCNVPDVPLDDATLDSLKTPWEENSLHANFMKSPLDRKSYKWNERKNDFNVWSKPDNSSYKDVPVTIFEAGTIKENLEKESAKKSKQIWQEKLVVDNPNIKVHRILPQTEMTISGPKCNNQIDKIKNLLKDSPTKKFASKNMDSIPALSVMIEPKSKESTKYGFHPGDSIRLTNDKNVIAISNNERSKYMQLKGEDFKLIHTNKSPVHKRQAKPITIEERARFNEYLHSEYCEVTPYVIPNNEDIEYITKNNNEKNICIKTNSNELKTITT